MKIGFGGNLCLCVLAVLSALMLPAFAQASSGAYSLNPDKSKILFTISHFVVSSTQGRFSSFDGTLKFDPEAPEHGAVIIHVSPGSISTDNEARDEHLRSADFFDVARFPSTVFESTALTKNSGKTGKLTGMLSLTWRFQAHQPGCDASHTGSKRRQADFLRHHSVQTLRFWHDQLFERYRGRCDSDCRGGI
jgi:polyisoprenoid-binding protein YceI